MVYGITPEESSSEKGKVSAQSVSDTYIPMSKTSVGITLHTWVKEAPVCTTAEPLTQFTQTIQGNSVVTVPAMTLVTDRVKTTTLQKPIEPNFYLPGAIRLSQSKTYQSGELTPEGNLALIIRVKALEAKYQMDMFMLDRYSGHLYVPDKQGHYVSIAEKGWIYPTEGMPEEPIAGNILYQGDTTPQSIQLSNFKRTPEAESTRDPIPI